MSGYQEALTWMYGLESRGVKLGLAPMQAALSLRGNPHDGLRYLHVAGTNGKGSVCAMTERALRAAGYRTGWFSSPHLHRYVERIRINGRPIAEAEMARRLFSLRDDPRLPQLTFFEYTTVAAFEAFREHGCDVVVLEVGLGGRLDSTNVVSPTVTVVTNIGLDHMHVLGDNIRSIAREKAGIIKARAPLVTGVRDPVAAAVMTEKVRRMGTTSWRLGRDFSITPTGEKRGEPRVPRGREGRRASTACSWPGRRAPAGQRGLRGGGAVRAARQGHGDSGRGHSHRAVQGELARAPRVAAGQGRAARVPDGRRPQPRRLPHAGARAGAACPPWPRGAAVRGHARQGARGHAGRASTAWWTSAST